jgi:hypothetical protein
MRVHLSMLSNSAKAILSRWDGESFSSSITQFLSPYMSAVIFDVAISSYISLAKHLVI